MGRSLSSNRPLILVTNDDGFYARGLVALAEAMERLGDVVVAAPDREQSGSSHKLTLDRPLRVRESTPNRFRIDGTPTDCVHLAICSLTERRPDLVVSGINRGVNVGDDITYSGTVAGALEGALLDVPALAFSVALDGERRADYTHAADFAHRLASRVLTEGGLGGKLLLNVNLPHGAPRGVRVTRQGTRSYRAQTERRTDPAGRPYYWIAGVEHAPDDEPQGDHAAIDEGLVSVTPLHANLTHEPSLEEVAGWNLRVD